MAFFRSACRVGVELGVGATLLAGLGAVTVAGIQVRAAVGAYQFSKIACNTIREVVRSGGNSLNPIPQFPADDSRKAFESDISQDEGNLGDLLEHIGTDEKKKVVLKRHLRGRFSYRLALAGKNHFGGTPINSRANQMSVMRFLVGKCEEHGLTVTDTRRCTAEAMAVCFTPDAAEINMYKALNSHQAYLRQVGLKVAKTQDKWWWSLLMDPIGYNAWQRAWMVLSGMGDAEAFQFVK